MKSAAAKIAWQPQTHFRELTLLQGAFSSLAKYAHNVHCGINLDLSPTWKEAKDAWSRLSVQHQPVNQPAATCEEIQLAINNCLDFDLRAFVMLLWLSCARKGDVAKLRSGDVQIFANGRTEIFIQEGKGVLARQGKYHIVSHCPPAWLPELTSFLMNHSTPRSRLFHQTMGSSNCVVDILRTANPSLNCRSVRRGALQTIAADQSVDEETLLRMSGHRNVKMLHRYLDWDRINERAHLRAHEAAKNLTRNVA
jgi:integrase